MRSASDLHIITHLDNRRPPLQLRLKSRCVTNDLSQPRRTRTAKRSQADPPSHPHYLMTIRVERYCDFYVHSRVLHARERRTEGKHVCGRHPGFKRVIYAATANRGSARDRQKSTCRLSDTYAPLESAIRDAQTAT